MPMLGLCSAKKGRDKSFLSIHWCVEVAKRSGWILDIALGCMV